MEEIREIIEYTKMFYSINIPIFKGGYNG